MTRMGANMAGLRRLGRRSPPVPTCAETGECPFAIRAPKRQFASRLVFKFLRLALAKGNNLGEAVRTAMSISRRFFAFSFRTLGARVSGH
jgi:hypothetical protein